MYPMMRINAVLASAITLLLPVVIRGDDMGNGLEKLAGTWTCASATDDGKPVAEETVKKLRLTVTKEGGYKTELGDDVLFDSICKVDTAKAPKRTST